MKIAIVDDHQIIIDGIEMLLGLEKNIAILKTYTDACDFLLDMREAKINPDLLLMDLIVVLAADFNVYSLKVKIRLEDQHVLFVV